MPWFIGLVIIAACDVWIVYQIYTFGCQAPGVAQALVLIAIPVVYLVLMYMTLKSQD